MNKLSRSHCVLILGSGMHAHLAALFAAQASSDLCVIALSDPASEFDDAQSAEDMLINALHEKFNDRDMPITIIRNSQAPSLNVRNVKSAFAKHAEQLENVKDSLTDSLLNKTFIPASFKMLDAKSATLKCKSRGCKQKVPAFKK